MGRLAEEALVQVRDVGSDQLALAARQRVVAAQEHLGQLEQRRGGLGPEGQTAADAAVPSDTSMWGNRSSSVEVAGVTALVV